MFQSPFSRCFKIRRFAIRFNESFTVRDEFSMKTVWEVVFFGLRSDDGPAVPVRPHLSITLVSDGPAGSTRHVGPSSGTIAQQRVRDVARASKLLKILRRNAKRPKKRGDSPRVLSSKLDGKSRRTAANIRYRAERVKVSPMARRSLDRSRSNIIRCTIYVHLA